MEIWICPCESTRSGTADPFPSVEAEAAIGHAVHDAGVVRIALRDHMHLAAQRSRAGGHLHLIRENAAQLSRQQFRTRKGRPDCLQPHRSAAKIWVSLEAHRASDGV